MNPGAAVEVVSVLRDEEPELAELLEFEEGKMGRVGPYLTGRDPPHRCRQASVAPGPHPVRTTKVRDARVGAYAGARKGNHVLGPYDPPRDLLYVPPEASFAGHGPRRDATRLLLPAAVGTGTLHLPQAGGFHPALVDQLPHLTAVALRPPAPRAASMASAKETP